MRIRDLVAAVGAAALLVGLTAAPAAAGTGASQICTDGIGWFGQGLTSPVTLALEVSYDPLNPAHQTVWLCYSTSATTTPNSIIGGAIGIDVWTGTDPFANPGAYVALHCWGDANVSVGPLTCFVPNSANTAPVDVVPVPQGQICLVALNGTCLYTIPGVALYTNRTGWPVLSLTVAGVYVPVDLPAQCLSVGTNC